MDKDKIKELGNEWKVQNENYDNIILDMINAPEPTPITVEKMEELKKMQDELFNLEVELFEVLKEE